MNMLNTHIKGIKDFLAETDKIEGTDKKNLLGLLTRLEETVRDLPDRPVDRLLKKEKLVDGIMSTVISGRIGNLTEKEIREQLERAFDTGQLSGIGLEHRKEYNVAVILKGGTFSEIWSDRPGINIHKFDVDKHGDDPVLYQVEPAEYASMFNPDEILKALESKFK